MEPYPFESENFNEAIIVLYKEVFKFFAKIIYWPFKKMRFLIKKRNISIKENKHLNS